MGTTATDLRQGLQSGVAFKTPVRAATTDPITLSGLQTIDDVALAAGDRVLVKDQVDEVENGIYVTDTSTWQRAEDFDSVQDVRTGTQVRVNEGTAAGGSIYYLSTTDPVAIDTSQIVFAQQTALTSPSTGGSSITITISTGTPSGGSDKDLWFQV